ncbi:Actin-related protein 8 [Portunus trituberculatus]|uniref:Actin-related protein 8 n=1 Tax=Portunus trituberculatus TaxID=210409 RepID=A0A5B7K5X8_PORTR|nr:Actin-related protein 8 [Portunus trituberculatus]
MKENDNGSKLCKCVRGANTVGEGGGGRGRKLYSATEGVFPGSAEGHLEAQASIILHPGSRYLRIGRPSDSVPHTILHAIARHRRSGISSYSDPFLVPHVKLVSCCLVFITNAIDSLIAFVSTKM